jgi:hypothetical protein
LLADCLVIRINYGVRKMSEDQFMLHETVKAVFEFHSEFF